MADVGCSSDDTTLQSCEFNSDNSSCFHEINDVGLDCSGDCSLYRCSSGECVDGEECDDIADCADGSDESLITCSKNKILEWNL